MIYYHPEELPEEKMQPSGLEQLAAGAAACGRVVEADNCGKDTNTPSKSSKPHRPGMSYDGDGIGGRRN